MPSRTFGGSFLRLILALLESMLLTRLVLKLFAARPDHPVMQAIVLLSQPFIAPLAWLDAGQPRSGAVLEFSTLVICVLLPMLWLILVRGIWRVEKEG